MARDGVVYKDDVLAATCLPPSPLRYPPTPVRPPPPPPLTAEHLPFDDDGESSDDDGLSDTDPDKRRERPTSHPSISTGGQTAGRAAAAATGTTADGQDAFHSVLILVPLRLGLHTLNDVYDAAIKVRVTPAVPLAAHEGGGRKAGERSAPR